MLSVNDPVVVGTDDDDNIISTGAERIELLEGDDQLTVNNYAGNAASGVFPWGIEGGPGSDNIIVESYDINDELGGFFQDISGGSSTNGDDNDPDSIRFVSSLFSTTGDIFVDTEVLLGIGDSVEIDAPEDALIELDRQTSWLGVEVEYGEALYRFVLWSEEDLIEGENLILPSGGRSNARPVANDDAVVTSQNTSIVVDVLANDTDVDGDDLTIDSVNLPQNGTTRLLDDGKILFSPGEDFIGNIFFEYRVSDDRGGIDSGRVDINVIESSAFDTLIFSSGFFNLGGGIADAINGPSDARWYKIFDGDQGGFITEGASRVLGGWVPAADLDQIDLNEGRYFVKSWGPDSGLSDFVSGNISFGNRDSFVEVGRPEVAANQDITLDQIIDASNLADDGSVRVFVPGRQDFGFLSGDELGTETFNFGSDGTRTTIWIDTFLSGQGRSGWSRTEVTADADVAAPSETISVAGVAEGDVSAFGLG
jgi:hypothetical protein